ncbi:hypothetical protein Vretimale_2131 [Volvox reticuliferus]|uniref:Uncharacterized protein n=1 Tax=Volvox reticuliferus TaxID=1737510 RepID=A0A8J4C486_9CHLO|nr:hypothetical protein Vretifemale_4409 [Volvox reticuliferus]GIL96285.1 hypothetical protein Vretimale_2131 [Volvox reticuliferus]
MTPDMLRRKSLRASNATAARRSVALKDAAQTRRCVLAHYSKPSCSKNVVGCKARPSITQLRAPQRRRSLASRVAAALHASPPAGPASSSSTFAASASPSETALTMTVKVVVPYHPTSHGQQLVLVGSCEALGNWDVNQGAKFTWCEGHSHVAEVELPIHTSISCKLVVQGHNNDASWEPEANRDLLLTPSSLASRAAGYTVLCHWGYPECTQILANSLRRGGAAASGSGPINKMNGHNARPSTAVGDNPILAGVKKALAHASSRDVAVIPGIISSWEDDTGALAEEEEEDAAPVQCQVTVLVPKSGPNLKPEQSLVLVGSSSALGCWNPEHGLPLERAGEDSPMWVVQAELPLGEGLQAKVVVVDSVSGAAQVWEPCENRSLARFRGGARPVMITAYWGAAPTHCLEVDRLSSNAAATNPQVVQMLRQQLAATASQLDGLRHERDEARKAVAASEEQMRSLEGEVKSLGRSGHQGRQEMVQLAEQLQTTRRLYEVTKKEALELGGTVGVTRQLCSAAKRELVGLATQLESAKRAYEALAPQVERMERQLASTTKAFEATKPELLALEAQLERARSLFDRTLQKIEAAKALTTSRELEPVAVRRRGAEAVKRVAREVQFAKF